jgi:hypothetical protein
VTLRGYDQAAEMLPITCPNVPNVAERGTHVVPFTGTFYLERTDFREVDQAV